MSEAPRLLSRLWRGCARGGGLALVLLAGAAQAQISDARYEGPTERYPHAVLGDAVEHESLVVTLADGREIRATYPDTIVFEDTEPRVVDVTGDGAPEVVVVESHERLGARLAIWGVQNEQLSLLAATPHIGTRFRWLAPAGLGAADLDGDGAIELAFVDRPHLAKTLHIWRFESGGLTEVAALPGVTNHRIGERDIAGGIRDCGEGPEVILADANWQNVLAVTYRQGALEARRLGPHSNRGSFASAMACE